MNQDTTTELEGETVVVYDGPASTEASRDRDGEQDDMEDTDA